jgi:hypothetical protein
MGMGMKNKFTDLIIILILLSVFTGCFKNKTGAEHSQSETEQEYIHKFGFFFNDEMETFRRYFDNNHNMPVEAIGWSKDGLFAYRYKSFNANIFREYTDLESPPREYIAEFPARYSLVIINTVTNEIIEEDSIEIGEGVIGTVEENSIFYLYDENEWRDLEGDTANLNEILETYKNKWEGLLQKHNIIGRVDDLLADNFQAGLSDFPIDNYSCWFDYTIESDEDNYLSELDRIYKRKDVVKWKLMIGNNAAQKIIGENDEIVMAFDMIGSKILGYYKNPFENTIVVVASYYWYTDYPESDTLWGTVNLFSCNMDNIQSSQQDAWRRPAVYKGRGD